MIKLNGSLGASGEYTPTIILSPLYSYNNEGVRAKSRDIKGIGETEFGINWETVWIIVPLVKFIKEKLTVVLKPGGLKWAGSTYIVECIFKVISYL